MVTICFTHFQTLTLANFAAALYSVRRQDLSRVAELVVFDNNSTETAKQMQEVLTSLDFPMPVQFQTVKHDDPTRCQAWSTNATVRLASEPWVFYTRSDYLLDFDMLRQFVEIVDTHPADWDGFITSHGCHLGQDITVCEGSAWRQTGPGIFSGVNYDYTSIDSGVWMARRATFDRVGGFDERLSAWGHAQTEFQHRVYEAGVEFVRIPQVLFFHPQHAAPRDITVAHQQLRDVGLDIRKLWERYEGPKIY